MHHGLRERHSWRYHVEGYACDNSELSRHLWSWLYFLRTARPDAYRMAEMRTRHTSEVDAYHLGPYRGLRHAPRRAALEPQLQAGRDEGEVAERYA